MEVQERDILTKNLPLLIQNTSCSSLFLSYFLAADIMTKEELDQITGLYDRGQRTQASKDLYNILSTRVGGFGVLVKALDASRQTGALDLLKWPMKTDRKPSKNRRFIQPPKKVKKLLSSATGNILLLGTCSAAVTKEKILDNILDAVEVHETTILSAKLQCYDTSSILVLDLFTDIVELISSAHRYNSMVKLVVIIEKGNIETFLKSYGIRQEDVSYGFDTISWDCVEENFKKQIFKRVQHKCRGFQLDECLDSLDEHHIVALINDNEGPLFANNLPDEPSYYIPRTLVGRNMISFSVLDKHTNDIWLIEDIDELALANKASLSVTATCTDQLFDQQIACSFMTVDHQTNFDEICNKTEKSVHLLKHENDNLYWVKTRGQIDEVLVSIDRESQSVMTEFSFIGSLRQTSNGKGDLVCISDTPGMGKSYLIYSLGRQLRQFFPERCVVSVSCVDLIEQAKLVFESISERKTLGTVVATAISKNVVAKTIFTHNLWSTFNKIELLLDGFDEIHVDDIELAELVLKTLNIDYPKIRIWLTTRPHYLKRLEISFGILGYNILPFDHENQLNFLQRFWQDAASTQNRKLNVFRLKMYSEHCLLSIKSEFNKDDNDIAGVPLQCMLIAEIFKGDAFKYIQLDKTDVIFDFKRFNVNSMSELFDLLVETKLSVHMQRIGSTSKLLQTKLLQIHFYFSLFLQFPKYAEYYKASLLHQDISRSELLAVGLMFCTDHIETPRFLHRTYAEFFAAKFILSTLKNGTMTHEFKDFLFTKVFSNNQTNFVIPFKAQIPSYTFLEHPICYFLNAVLPSCNAATPFYVNLLDQFDEYYKKALLVKRIGHSCAQYNYLQLLMLLSHTKALDNYSNYSLLDKEFLAIVMYRCDVSFAKFCLNLFQHYNLTPIDSIRIRTFTSSTSLFHLCVSGAKFDTTQYLLKNTGFESCLNKQQIDFHNVIHSCVEWSVDEPKLVVTEKHKILEYLQSRFGWTFSSKYNNITPLLCQQVHISYVDKLLRSKRDCFATDSSGGTVFHQLALRNTCHDLQRLLIHASAKVLNNSEMSELLSVRDNNKNTLLHTLILSCGTITIPILQLLKNHHADFNTRNLFQSTLLSSAIETHRNRDILSFLVNSGADIKFRFPNQSTLLHLAANVGNVTAANYILQLDSPFLCLNLKDGNGLTPLNYAENDINSRNCSGKEDCIQLFLKGIGCFYDHKKSFVGSANGHEVMDTYAVSKLISLRNSEKPINFLLILFREVPQSQFDSESVSLYCSYDKNCLTYSKNGVGSHKLFLQNLGQENPSIIYIIDLLSKTLKFRLGPLKYLSIPSEEKSAESLLTWIFEQRISDAFVIELLDKFLNKFTSYLSKLREIMCYIICVARTATLISWIISKGASPISVDSNGNTPLHIAFSAPPLSTFGIISCLINAGANINTINSHGQTALLLGCQKLSIDSLKTLNLFLSHDAVNTPVLASMSLRWLIYQQDFSDKEFDSTATKLVLKGADIYFIENKDNQTLLGLAFEKQGVKRAMLLDKLYKSKCARSGSPPSLHNSEDSDLLESLEIGFYLYTQSYRITNKNISRIQHCSKTSQTQPMFSVSHLDSLLKKLYLDSHDNILVLVAYMISLRFRGGLEYVCEWCRKNIETDLTEQPLCFLNGQPTDPLRLSVIVGDFACVEYVVERVGFRKHLFSEKYKALVFDYIHLDNAPEFIEYFYNINPNLILENGRGLFLHQRINPNAFIALVEIFGSVDLCSFTKENIHNINKDGQTIMHLIPKIVDCNEYHEIILSLAKQGLLDVFKVGSKHLGNTPLHDSISCLELESPTLDVILQSNIDINFCNEQGDSVLVLAVKNKRSINLITYLISNGADLTNTDWDQKSLQRSIMHLIVSEYNHTEDQLQIILHCLLNQGMMHILNCTDRHNNAVLHYIIQTFHLSIKTLDLLLHSSVNCNVLNEFRQNILHIASQNKLPPKLISTFVKHGVATDQKDKNEKVFLHYAIEKYSSQYFEELICILKYNNLAKLFNEPDSEGFTPLVYAARKPELLGIVVNHLSNDKTVEWNYLDKANKTFLHHADICELDTFSIHEMVCCGVNIWQQDNQGEIFAHHFAKDRSNHNFDKLIEYVFKYDLFDLLSIKNISGYNVIFLALMHSTILTETLQSVCKVGLYLDEHNSEGNFSYLHAAAMGSNVEYIKILIKAGRMSFQSKNTKKSFMHTLAEYSTPDVVDEIVKFLVEHKLTEELKALDAQLNTPVHIAILKRSILPQTIITLFKSNIDLNVQNILKCTPLHMAVEHFDLTLIKVLLDCNVNLSILDSNGDTFMHKAAKCILNDLQCKSKEDIEEIENKAAAVFHKLVLYLSDLKKVDIFKIPDAKGILSLHRSIQCFDVSLSTLDIFHDSDVNFSLEDMNGVSTLMHAVYNKRSVNFLKKLILLGTEVYQTDNDGNHIAHLLPQFYCAEKYHEIVSFLTDKGHGHIFKILNKHKVSPLHTAVWNLEVLEETLHLLAGVKIKPNLMIDSSDYYTAKLSECDDLGVISSNVNYNNLIFSDNSGETVLFYAVRRKRSLSMVKYLVTLGADPLAKNYKNHNLVHTSASFGSLELLQYFIDFELDINELDNDGNNALQCAIINRDCDIYEILVYLINFGADRTHENKDCRTAYQCALDKGISDSKILDLLLEYNY